MSWGFWNTNICFTIHQRLFEKKRYKCVLCALLAQTICEGVPNCDELDDHRPFWLTVGVDPMSDRASPCWRFSARQCQVGLFQVTECQMIISRGRTYPQQQSVWKGENSIYIQRFIPMFPVTVWKVAKKWSSLAKLDLTEWVQADVLSDCSSIYCTLRSRRPHLRRFLWNRGWLPW